MHGSNLRSMGRTHFSNYDQPLQDTQEKSFNIMMAMILDIYQYAGRVSSDTETIWGIQSMSGKANAGTTRPAKVSWES